MLKIKKLVPEQLEDLTFNDYKKIVRPLFKAIKDKHAAPDKLVDFFIITDFEFSDKPGKKSTIFVPGKQDTKWKKFLKEKFKDDKKNVLIGKCYVGDDNGKPALSLLPERGKAKMMKIKKQGKKMFNMVQLAIQMATSAQDSTDDALEEQEEEQTNASNQASTSDNTDGQGQQEEPLQATRELLKEQLVNLATQLKSVKQGLPQIKPIVQKYKQQAVTEEEASMLQDIVESIEDFVEGHEEAHQKVKERLQSAYNKVAGQLPKLQALLEKVNELLEDQTIAAEDDDEEEDTLSTTQSNATSDSTDTVEEEDAQASTQESSTTDASVEEEDAGILAEEIEQLRQTMTTAKTRVDQLLQEIDLDALVAQIA